MKTDISTVKFKNASMKVKILIKNIISRDQDFEYIRFYPCFLFSCLKTAKNAPKHKAKNKEKDRTYCNKNKNKNHIIQIDFKPQKME